ncbi:biliverdin-producing heme oxygenase (plasmid) [Deinococcus aquaticus]|uniref:Biliverdin-producing heme oxygenase n=1 Tax=Deinococcus aquaticus TaxID=328692 RepID=A0ABY7V6Z4_9DEIO|nr:biliverdin-producing heme oxygenase [Deinococcus aquaticus]WDA60399.1 biliverdin-producing heme oxygenase [Deinococcus aquaticus]
MILPQLKTRTRVQHEQAEASLDLMNPHLTRERYVQVLRRMWTLYVPLEDRLGTLLGPAGRAALDWPARLKRPLLERDLRDLRSPLPDAPGGAGDRLEFLQAEADAWGAAYVLEGATLGGQLLRRHLGTQLDLGAGGAAFYSSYGELVGPRWKAFGAALEARGAADADPAAFAERAVQSAGQTFGLFISGLSVPEVLPALRHGQAGGTL